MGTRPSVDNIRSLPNFTQLFRWAIAFSSPPSAVDYPGNEAINFRAESQSLPTLSPGSTEIVIRGNKIKEPGIADYGNQITLTCVETVDSIISEFISSWQNACWEMSEGSTGKTRDKKDLEATMVITRLNNMDEPIYKYELFGVFLETEDAGGELGSDSADPLKPVLTLSFDRFTREKL